MLKFIQTKKPLAGAVSIAMLAAFAAFVLLFAAGFHPFFVDAEAKRPARGSVQFGARAAPEVNIPPALQGFTTVFADVAEKVVPVVVSVIPTKIDTVVFTNNPFYQHFRDPFFGGNPFEEFFGGRQNQQRRPQQSPQVQRQERRQQGIGSGVIVSRDGYILTNSHVVSGAAEIEVKTHDGRSFNAEVVGADSLADVAVLKIKDRVSDLPVAFLGDSDKLRPGDWAVAIGNPFSLSSSVTMGIVSATGRAAPMPGMSQGFQDFIQTDAAINPGNSGGALVNIKGELVGINTMIYTRSGGNMGIGFAIPINMARRVMEDLIFDGRVSRGWLGISIQELDQSTRDAFSLPPETKGVLVADVFKNQPADKAGIKRGDVITGIDGKATETLNQLRNHVAAVRPGKTIPVQILRSGARQTVRVTVTSRDESEVLASAGGTLPPSSAGRFIGMSVGAITNEVRNQQGIPPNAHGVVITELDRNGQAVQEGLRESDIILEVNRTSISSVDGFTKAVKDIKPGDSVLLLVRRDGSTFYRAFRVRG